MIFSRANVETHDFFCDFHDSGNVQNVDTSWTKKP